MPPTIRRAVWPWPGSSSVDDEVIAEEPLEIRVEGIPLAVTLRTPGHDLELAAGFLYTEGVVDGRDDLVALAHVVDPRDPRLNTVDCRLAGGVEAHAASVRRATRELYATSSCGVCGKASIDRLKVLAGPLTRRLNPPLDLLARLPAVLRTSQELFHATGGVHGAALFAPDGTLEVVREDIGRHNAVDKVLGWRLLNDRAPVDDRILMVSSRAGFEIVQKALVARVPVVASVGAASSMAVDLAQETGILLVGFVREGRMVQYTDPAR